MLRSWMIISGLSISIMTQSQTLRMGAELNFIPGKFSYVMPDNIGNLFALTISGQLKKYNTRLDSMGVFNDVRRYGKIGSISSQNPLRTICFFKEYKTILILDRLMQVVNKIDLRKSGMFQVQSVTQSYDNKIWVFDEQESRIKKLDEDGKILFASVDLRLIFQEPVLPNVIFDSGGFLYLYDPSAGLFIFDYYGTLKNRIALLGWKDVQPFEKQILGTKDGKLQVYTLNTLDIKEYELPAELKVFSQLRFTTNVIYALKDDGIACYGWEK